MHHRRTFCHRVQSNCDSTPTSSKFLFPDLPAHQCWRPGRLLINGNRSEATTKPKWSQEKAQWQHPGGKRSAAVLLPVLLVQYASRHFPPVRSRTYLVTYNTSIYFISTRTETLLLAYSKWRKRTRAVLENAQLQREQGKWAKLETSPCLQTYFFCYSNLNRAKPKNLLLKEPIRWACRL